MSDILQEVRQRYINAKNAGREGSGCHRSAGSSGHVHDLLLQAIRKADAAGLDWKTVMTEGKA